VIYRFLAFVSLWLLCFLKLALHRFTFDYVTFMTALCLV
jgi:hypothetical protein